MKIRPEELRIGNLLRDKVSKTELEVIELTKENIITYVIDRSKYPLKEGWGIEAIPLTEEWLNRFGYLEYAPGKYDRDDFWTISTWQGRSKQVFWVKDLDVELEYVHQLQNLYSSTNFKELKPSNEK